MKLLIALLLLCSSAQASTLDLTITAGLGKGVLTHDPFERMVALGVRYGDILKVQGNVGYWMATAAGDKSSPYASAQIGVEVVGASGIVASFMVGPAYVMFPDGSKNSSHFQFNPTIALGINARNFAVMIEGWHESNLGIWPPNNGRDLVCGKLIFPLWRSK